jgi:DNA polymerase-3 subunit gamma/tau
MAYQVLARKYRPQLFSDVIGQDHVTRTLLNALAQNRIAHGYIFSGHRGIGKTTIARILAAALNCSTPVGDPARPTEEPCRICVNCREISSASRQETSIFEESHSFDVEEIDAATNRGIDDARLLTTKIQTRPTNKSKYRIIILDEAHQITDAAWNALLKTLEEPPEWAVFMFAISASMPSSSMTSYASYASSPTKKPSPSTKPRSPCSPKPAMAPCATRSPSWTRPSRLRR